MLEKLYWNQHKYDSISLELSSFGSIINYCLFYNLESTIFLENNDKFLYFSPLPLGYKLFFVIGDNIKEVNVKVFLLPDKQFDTSILLISYFKNVLEKDDFNHLLCFIEKIKFWKKSKSRFFTDIELSNNTITIKFNKLSPRIENIFFS